MDPRRVLKENGYSTTIIVEKDAITLHVMNKTISAGQIKLTRGRKYWQTYSSIGIPHKLRGQGVGLYLYKKLIRYGLKHGFMIRSAYGYQRNVHSNKIWKKLCKSFTIEKRHNCYYVVGPKS